MKTHLGLFVIMLAATSVCQADLVVENESEASSTGIFFRHPFFSGTSNTWAQSFNTGGGDYQLDSIAVSIYRDTTVADFDARLWSANATNSAPLAPLLSFSLSNTPTSGSFERYVFTPNAGFTLDGGADYFFSIENNVGTRSFIELSVTGSNHFTGPGSLVDELVGSVDSGSTWFSSNNNALVIRVDGTAISVPEPSCLLWFSPLVLAATWRRRR